MSRICIVGGAGFLGRNIAELLVREQHVVIVPTRRRERAKRDLLMLPTLDLVEADVHDDATLDRLFARCDAVINLVGILHSRSGTPYGPDFARAHVELPRRIVAACERQGVKRLIHVSALGASTDAPSEYLRSKADGEAAVMAARDRMAVTILQPSVVFGDGDAFLNLFARMQRHAPFVPLGMPDARFQPVWVEDVARVVLLALDDEASFGKIYPLAGPRVYTLRELVEFAGRASGHPRTVVGLGRGLAMVQATVLEWLPGGLMSRDNVRSMEVHNTTAATFPFGIEPSSLESVAPSYLSGVWPRTRFDRHRHRAGRHVQGV